MTRLSVVALVFVTGAAACTSLGGMSDGTSVSYGWSSRGSLVAGVQLPVRGDGYVIPGTWSARGLNWGTEELVGILVRASRRVRAESAEATVYVADLSPRYGGPSAWHRSHQTGRDADLHLFALEDGRPAAPPSAMIRYDAAGLSAPVDEAGALVRRRAFDVARNWLLVRALLEDPVVEVQFLFISAPLRQMLLDHAIAEGEPADLVARASAVMQQPADSLPHDDHLHLRIYCPADDRSLGCRDRGPQRWLKKGWKYASEPSARASFTLASVPAPAPMCRLIGSSLFAGR